MTIKITLEFKNVDEAIVAMSKLIAAPVAKDERQLELPLETKPARKPGSGRKPNPNSKRQQRLAKEQGAAAPAPSLNSVANPGAIPGEAPAAAVPSEKAAAPVKNPSIEASQAAQAPDAVAPVPTDEEVKAAGQAVLEAKGIEVVKAALAKFGVRRGGELTPAQRVEYVAYMKSLV